MIDRDEGRTDAVGNKEFIVETTGGPTKYYNQLRKRNPFFTEPKDLTTAKIDIKWYQEFISSFRHARLVEGLTQKQLAETLGSNQAAISKFERGLTNPTLKNLLDHARALGMDIKLGVTTDSRK